MKRTYSRIILVIFAVFMTSACAGKGEQNVAVVHTPTEETRQVTDGTEKGEETPGETAEDDIEESTGDSAAEGEQEKMQEMIIEVGGQSVHATLYDNETVRALQGMLPMTLRMDELHFSTPYRYTRIGHIEDPEAFTKTLANAKR